LVGDEEAVFLIPEVFLGVHLQETAFPYRLLITLRGLCKYYLAMCDAFAVAQLARVSAKWNVNKLIRIYEGRFPSIYFAQRPDGPLARLWQVASYINAEHVRTLNNLASRAIFYVEPGKSDKSITVEYKAWGTSRDKFYGDFFCEYPLTVMLCHTRSGWMMQSYMGWWDTHQVDAAKPPFHLITPGVHF
jgi:hypothetical protein